MDGTSTRVRYSGLGIAVLAFGLTRLLVAPTLEADAVSFMVAGLLPLAAGLALTVVGIVLAVGAYSPAYVRTVWIWTAAGTAGTGLVVATASVHSVLVGDGFEPVLESGALVANVVLGGAIGGSIVGDRLARGRTERENLARYAERTTLVNRRLRHEVRNAAAVLRGYAFDGGERAGDPSAAIRESVEGVEDTLAEATRFGRTDGRLAAVDLGAALEAAVAEAPPSGPDVDLEVRAPEGTLVRADDRLPLLVGELVENAVEHAGPDATVTVSATAGDGTASITVTDDGPGLPAHGEAALSARSLPATDDPTFGYGLGTVRLLAEHYGGELETDAEDGTAITVTLHRTTEEGLPALGLGVARADLLRAVGAGLLAGLATGVPLALGGSAMTTVGALYGVEGAVVGWVAHLFHSVVFGLGFATLARIQRLGALAETRRGRIAIGLGWGLALWAVGAALAMPIWLLAVDVPASVPSLDPVWLAVHLGWGALLGWLYGVLPVPDRLLE